MSKLLPRTRWVGPIALVLGVLCFNACLSSYRLAPRADAVPHERAVVVGRLEAEGHNEWSVLLETPGDTLELPVARGGYGIFVWTLPAGEWRVSAIRRYGADGASLPGSSPAATQVTLRSDETPWFVLEAGGAFCLGTIDPLGGPRRSILGSIKGTFRYDADCSFDDIPSKERPESRWRWFPWDSAPLVPLPVALFRSVPDAPASAPGD